MMGNETWFFVGFLSLFLLLLFLDLGIFEKKKEEDRSSLMRSSLTAALILVLSLLFCVLLIKYGSLLHGIDDMEKLAYTVQKYGHPVDILSKSKNFEQALALYQKNLGLEFLAGYIVEYALSVDNVFVMLMIFGSFSVHKNHYHKVLFWGILGAVVLRFFFIFAGSSLLQKFEWITYLLGLFLLYTSVNLFLSRNKEEKMDLENHVIMKFLKKYIRIHPQFLGDRFFAKIEGKNKATPLFLALVLVEFTDLIFAVDSIPAIFSITRDPYIVFFSNVFAVTGLRSLFFLLSALVSQFRYLKHGISVLLGFIGLKMLLHQYFDVWGFTTVHSLVSIVSILSISVLCSLLNPIKK